MSQEVFMKMKHLFLFLRWLIFVLCITACERGDALHKISTSRAGVGYGVHVHEGYAYITNNEGVIIFDVHDPTHPKQIASIPTGYTPGILVQGDWAYIASESGLTIADISDPSLPQKVSKFPSEGIVHKVQLAGSLAYLASSAGLEIVDISIPTAPTKVGHLTGGDAWGIDVHEDIVYLAVPTNGLEVVDVRDLSSPKKVSTVAGTQSAWDVHVHPPWIYVGCHANGIKILSLTDKESPQIVGHFLDQDGGEALGVWGDGETLYVADNFRAEVLDVLDPTQPREVGEYPNLNGAHDIYVEENLIYIAEGKKGLIILEFTGGNP
jgi:hypothetical protein